MTLFLSRQNMSNEDIALFVGLIVFIIVEAIGIAVAVWYAKKHPKKPFDYDSIPKPKTEFTEAKIIDKKVIVSNVGSLRMPRSVTEYYITFLLKNGEEKEYSVSQEMFEKTEKGQEATLVLLNDMFFDFGDGEDVCPEEEQSEECTEKE